MLIEKEVIELMGLKNLKDRKVACYSISAKNMNNLDVAMNWLSDLNTIN